MAVVLILITQDDEIIKSSNILNYNNDKQNARLCHQIGTSIVKRIPNIKVYNVITSDSKNII